MKVLFFTKGDKSAASSRFRVWYVAERLQKNYKFDFEIIHSISYSFWKPSIKRFQIFRSIYRKALEPDVKVIFVHKSLFPADIVFLLIALKIYFNKKIIFDLDDAEWIHSGFKSRLLARNANVVFCGSHEILNWAKKYNSKTELIPTVVDHNPYLPYVVTPQSRQVYTIGWEGAPGHFYEGHLDILKSILDEYYRVSKNKFRLVLISSEVEGMKKLFINMPYEVLYDDTPNWAEDEVATARALKKYEVDVAFNPLIDNLWNRSKCSFKSVEYMACGIPTLQSNVGENAFLTKDGENGYLFSTVDDAVQKLRELLDSLELRKKFSAMSLATIRTSYSYQSIIPRTYSILETLK